MCDDVERQPVPESSSSSSHEKLRIAKKLQEMGDSDTTSIPDRTLSDVSKPSNTKVAWICAQSRTGRRQVVISDEGLRMLALRLHYLDWTELATLLDFSAGQIVDFDAQNPDDIFQMLLTWRQLQDANTNQLETLSEKLKQVGMADLASRLLGADSRMYPLWYDSSRFGLPWHPYRAPGMYDPEWKDDIEWRATRENLPMPDSKSVSGVSKPSNKKVAGLTRAQSLTGRRQVVISDEVLRMLASRLHYLDWKELATLLDFSAGQISGFKTKHPDHLQMLLTWRQLQDANTDQLETLSKKLEEVGGADLARRLLDSEMYHFWYDSSPFVVPNEVLRWLAKQLGPDWEKLAISLGFSKEQISDFEAKNPNNIQDNIFEMLLTWKKQQDANTNQLKTLSRKMRMVGRVDLAGSLSVVSDEDLWQLVQQLGPHWKKLALCLGFSKEQSSDFVAESPYYVQNQIFQMLLKWKQKDANVNPLENLRFFPIDWSVRATMIFRGMVPSDSVNEDLQRFFKQLGPHRKELALCLGFSTEQSSDFEAKNPYHVQNQIFHMLLAWKRQQDGLPGSKPISTETTAHQKMVSLTADKACQGRGGEVQRSHEPSHLQQVLDEVHRMTENLSENEQLERRLQLPYIALGYFNEKGGSLYLDEYDVHLTIPCGAIASGSAQQVYIYVDPTAQKDDTVEPAEFSLSPSVECGPDGLRFKESLVLSFPHHADIKSTNSETLKPKMCQDKDSSDTWHEFDGNALITKDRVILLVNHFTRFKLWGGCEKLLLVVPYGDIFDPSQGKYQIRVHVLDDDEEAKIKVKENENELKQLDSFKPLSWAKGNLLLAVTPSELPDAEQFEVYEGKTQIIHENEIKKHASNSKTFTLKLKRKLLNNPMFCAVEVYQECEDEDTKPKGKVRLSICPETKMTDKDMAQKSDCDQGAASCQTVTFQPFGGRSTGTQTDTTLQEEVSNGFSKRQPSHSAMADSRDVDGSCSDTYKQVESVFSAENNSDASRKSGIVNDEPAIAISRNVAENLSSLLHKFSTELDRTQELETKEKRSRQEVIGDSTLRTLAGKLGSEWTHLATLLGFVKHDIYKFKSDNPHCCDDQIFEMLVKWRDEQYLEGQVDLLRKELRKAEKGDIANKLQDIGDQSLQMVSKELGLAWRSLVTSLNVDIQTSDTIEDMFPMLVKWRERHLSKEVQVGKLCAKLKVVDKEELADKLMRELLSGGDINKLQLYQISKFAESTGFGQPRDTITDNVVDFCERKAQPKSYRQQLVVNSE